MATASITITRMAAHENMPRIVPPESDGVQTLLVSFILSTKKH